MTASNPNQSMPGQGSSTSPQARVIPVLSALSRLFQTNLSQSQDQKLGLSLLQRVAELSNASGPPSAQIASSLEEISSFIEAKFPPNAVFADALHLLGGVAMQFQAFDLAIDFIGRAVKANPNDSEYHINFSNLLKLRGRINEAVQSLERAVALQPGKSQIELNLAATLLQNGEPDRAIGQLQRITTREPHNIGAHLTLANALTQQGRALEGIESLRQVARLVPGNAEAQYNLGVSLHRIGKLSEATTCFQRAIAIKPSFVEAYNNLATSLKDQGQVDESLKTYRQGLAINPANASLHSNLLYAFCFSDENEETIASEHERWAKAHAAPLRDHIQPHANDRSPDRRLRIGYVSSDFRQHSMQFFITPLLAEHNREQFEIYCYSNVAKPDAVTQKLRALADHWREIDRLDDETAAAMIHQDQIDILVDLTLHMARNRALIMARKPAPIQIAHLGYPGSTGLPTLDYRFTDPYLDPPEQPTWGPEKPLRLNCFWCYQPDSELPEVSALPARSNHRITFGSLNNPAKFSPRAIELWSEVLHQVPDSKLILLLSDDPGTHALFHKQFADHRIPPQRLEFVGYRPRPEYLHVYNRIDITLDPVPCVGHTTSCDSFWMGVPVVTLPGSNSVARGGVSLAATLDLNEWVAATPEHYVEIARKWASDLQSLSNLRGQLRDRIKQSPLMDASEYTRQVETAYRQVWQQWIATAGQ